MLRAIAYATKVLVTSVSETAITVMIAELSAARG